MGQVIFLGGTCGNNNWRERLIEALAANGKETSHLFNPVVKEWNAEAQAAEDEAKKNAVVTIYYVADPQDGVNPVSAYSLVEATMALYDRPAQSMVIIDAAGVDGHAAKVYNKVAKDLKTRFPSAVIHDSFNELVDLLNVGLPNKALVTA